MERRSRTKTKKFTYKMQANLLLAFGIVVVLLIILIGYLIKIHVKDGSRYAKRVLNQQSYTSSEIAYKRGDIIDRNGIVMATSIKVYNLVIDPSFVLTKSEDKYIYKDVVTEILSEYFGYDKQELNELLMEKSESRYYILEKKVSSEIVDGYDEYIEKYKKENDAIIKGVWFEEEYERKYPLSEVGSSVIGFTYDKNAGNWGIEGQYNDELNGSTGRSYGYYDSELNLERTVKDAVNGNTIVTTIDSNIQQIVERHIVQFQKDIGSKNAAVVIANPNTGEIVAMASSNGMYNLNKPRDLSKVYSKEEIETMSSGEKLTALNAIWRNYCISDTYEPGSTYKPFVVAAGLEEAILNGKETYVCDGKQVVVEGTKPIRCAKREGHGLITLKQAVEYSCNDALMAIGSVIGRETFARYQTHFGFGEKTGVDLMGESKGIVYDAEGLNPLELATSSFGQGLNVTMIQMVGAFSSLVNGGNYYEPHVVKQILNDNGAVVSEVKPVIIKKTVSDKTSDLLREYMQGAVEEGTAKSAAVKGYTVGGKTGTAQKLPRSDGKYLVSFIGFAPCEDPQLVIYTIVDEPAKEPQSVSKYAQDLSSLIMADVFPFMEIFASEEKEDVTKETSSPDSTTNPEETQNPLTSGDPIETSVPQETVLPDGDNIATINPEAAIEEEIEDGILEEE